MSFSFASRIAFVADFAGITSVLSGSCVGSVGIGLVFGLLCPISIPALERSSVPAPANPVKNLRLVSDISTSPRKPPAGNLARTGERPPSSNVILSLPKKR